MFCSVRCKGIWSSKNLIGDKASNYRGGTTKCSGCNKDLGVRYSQSKRPNVKCRKCRFKDYTGSNNPHWKGGPRKCESCKGDLGDQYSKLCRKCYRGPNHRRWRGGTSNLSQLIRRLPEYRRWYMAVYHRDNFTCQECKIRPKTATSLSAHHIVQFALILKKNSIKSIEDAISCSELWNVNNGLTLCRPCHRLTDSFAKKLTTS